MTVGRLGALAAVEREGDHLIEGLALFLLLCRVLGRVLQRREVVDERLEVDVGALRRGLLRVRGVHERVVHREIELGAHALRAAVLVPH
eukprot:scaffold45506_cov40-Phaeocystis_antarctica.AAC.1